MLTIGQMCKRFGLSRSTLIYYDKHGVLAPSVRSDANYRYYNDADIQRMEQIQLYKDAGLPLEEIKILLTESTVPSTQLLEQHLANLNNRINQLRVQQQQLLQLLGNPTLRKQSRAMGKAQWVNILSASGMSEQDMRQWHVEFERSLPEAHHDFLESLGISKEEIASIRLNAQTHWRSSATECD